MAAPEAAANSRSSGVHSPKRKIDPTLQPRCRNMRFSLCGTLSLRGTLPLRDQDHAGEDEEQRSAWPQPCSGALQQVPPAASSPVVPLR